MVEVLSKRQVRRKPQNPGKCMESLNKELKGKGNAEKG